MRRSFLFFLFCTLFLEAKSIHFTEDRYFDALGKSTERKGKITFSKSAIDIVYTTDHTHVRYDGHTLLTEHGNKVKRLDLRKKPAVKMFFVLFEAIYFDKQAVLDNYFIRQQEKHTVLLLPKGNVSHYITKVRYRKGKKKLHFLQIDLANNDRIRIEETK